MGHMLKEEVENKMRELITPMDGCRILEIGTGWGESSDFFSKLKPTWKVYTIDSFGLYGDGRIYKEFGHEKVKIINKNLGRNVIQILGDSSKIPWELPIDVLFIDGDHSFDGCYNDFQNFQLFVNQNGLVIFDDYNQPNNPHNGVKKAVHEAISNHDKFEIVYEGYYCSILKRIK